MIGRSCVLFLDCCMVTKWLLPFEASVIHERTGRNVPEDLAFQEHRYEHLTHCTQHLHFKAAFNRTTNGRSLGTRQKSDGRSEIEGHREMKVPVLY
jgi:signal recognition particle subunit SEC65